MFRTRGRQCLCHVRRSGIISGSRRLKTWSSLPAEPRVFASVLVAVGTLGLGLGIYKYYSIPPSPYPEEVNKFLRKALYYEGAGRDPKAAIHNYLSALEKATELRLDQTSDDISGLKIKIGGVYEHNGRSDSALKVYSGLLSELKSSLREPRLSEADHTRLLRRALGTSIKVGDLAAQISGHEEEAEKAYTWALENMLKKIKNEKGDSSWLGDEAEGGIYEAAAGYYYATGKHNLALPLYLKALDVAGRSAITCHTMTLMNNVASAIASQSTAPNVQLNALEWAQRARNLKVENKTDDRMECDLARCTAIANTAQIQEQVLRLSDARESYSQAFKAAQSLSPGDRRSIQDMCAEAIARIDRRHE